MNSSWVIQHQCPQCGAPITLEETDHILSCSFCRVRLYLAPTDYFRYFLAPPDTIAEDVIYAPYWRFRGMSFFCRPYEITERVIDATILAADSSVLPASLGVKPQALNLQFVHPGIKACFLKQQSPLKDIFKRIESLAETTKGHSKKNSFFYREFIGETISLVYAPFYRKGNTIYDAIVNQPVKNLLQKHIELPMPHDQNPSCNVTFLPTLCPDCGWDLKGEKESCVLFCANCNSAWKPDQTGFKGRDYGIMPAKGKEVLYVPFWMMKADVEGTPLSSYADLVRLANLPKVIQKGWEEKEVCFWSPAFKVPPRLFLRLAKQMTIFQLAEKLETELKNLSLYPVTLPLKEAAESIIVTIANITTDRKKLYPLLSEIKVCLREHNLIYVPFHVRANELVQCHRSFSISRNALKTGIKI